MMSASRKKASSMNLMTSVVAFQVSSNNLCLTEAGLTLQLLPLETDSAVPEQLSPHEEFSIVVLAVLQLLLEHESD